MLKAGAPSTSVSGSLPSSPRQTPLSASSADEVRERARFLHGREPFKGLNQKELEVVAASIVQRLVPAGEVVLVESGVPGTELYVIKDGTPCWPAARSSAIPLC